MPGAVLRRSDFAYDLPDAQIAQAPLAERDASRLLVLRASGHVSHARFTDITELLAPGDLLVVNDTRVLKARLRGVKDTGGAAEILVERIAANGDGRLALCQVRVSKPLKPRSRVFVHESAITMIERQGEFYVLEFPDPVDEFLERFGEVPLPPYVERESGPGRDDEYRYQTVYGERPGAVAAPTAGLHFTQALLDTIGARGIGVCAVTLHVGAGTFQPVRVHDLAQHTMHCERYHVTPEVADRIAATRAAGGRVVAVGTTVVRTLEAAAADDGRVEAGSGETRLFITPGYRFRVVDALVTNFHLPESTLLMLVCAFAGYGRVMDAYRTAVASGYRFFSYGDAMFCERPASDAGDV